MTNPFITAAGFVKTADPAQDQAIADLKQMALLSLGVGAAGRGAVGLYNTVKRNLSPHKVRYPGAIYAGMPYPVEAPPIDPDKLAFDSSSVGYMPAMAGIGIAGGVAGWTALDAVLENRRKNEENAELANARKNFETALVQNVNRPRQMKLAADSDPAVELSAELDSLFDKVAGHLAGQSAEKQAMPGLGEVVGDYLGLYGVPVAAGTAYLAYNSQKKKNQANIAEQAMQQRIRRSYQARPSEVLAVPSQVPVTLAPAEDEAARIAQMSDEAT